MKFEEVNGSKELIINLTEKASRFPNSKYVYHYTRLSNVLLICQSKKWLLGSPKKMNDGLELRFLGDKASHIGFASFLLGEKENIGMWSMYAQPWEEGVVIRIPIDSIDKWIAAKPAAQSVSKTKSEIIPVATLRDYEMTLHAVAYTDEEKPGDVKHHTLQCGNKDNTRMKNILSMGELAGYVKHSAWSYENEVRLRIDTPEDAQDGILVDIPDDVLSSFSFVAGPRFSKNLLAELRAVDDTIDESRVLTSLFTGRLKWVYCMDCALKKV